jgi:hypothetical protein
MPDWSYGPVCKPRLLAGLPGFGATIGIHDVDGG